MKTWQQQVLLEDQVARYPGNLNFLMEALKKPPGSASVIHIVGNQGEES